MAADEGAANRARSELDSAFRVHRDWLVRRLALIVGDAEEARDLAQQTFLARCGTLAAPRPDRAGPRPY